MWTIGLDNVSLDEAVSSACEIMANGGLVVYPTETIYGIAADAGNAEAVSRLLAFKNRPAGKAISLLVSDETAAEQVVSLNETARQLYRKFLPGPLSIVSASRHLVDSRLESEFGSLAIRISSYPFAAALAEAYGKPITATSANASGKARPYSIQTTLSGLSDRQRELIGLIVDAGILPANEPSTVIDTTQGTQELLRAGSFAGSFLEQLSTDCPEDTEELGARLTSAWLHLVPYRPLVFALEGPLGAGKTQFAKGVARALNIDEPVTSPSYTLVKEYVGSCRLVHADLWRTPNILAEEIGLPEYLKPGTVTVVEWAEPVMEYLRTREDTVRCLITIVVDSETGRQISVSQL